MSLSSLMSCCTWSRLHALISDSFISLLYSLRVVSLFVLNCSLVAGFACFYAVDEVSYRFQHFRHVLIWVFEDDLCFGLISVVLVFVRSPSVVVPVPVLIVIIPVQIALVFLVVPIVWLVSPISVVISVVSLSVVWVAVVGVAVVSIARSGIIWRVQWTVPTTWSIKGSIVESIGQPVCRSGGHSIDIAFLKWIV